MAKIGIHVADIGLPGSSQRAFDDVLRMCREITDNKLPLRVACAGRTVVSDITPMIEISQRAGIPVEIYAFIGSSPIRQLAEEWDLDSSSSARAEAIDVGVKAGLSVAYVTEDTTRSRPEVLATLFKMAIDHGASRLCLCDTVGHATPDGVRNLIALHQERSSPARAPRSASTGTATTIAASPSRTRSGRSSSAPTACTAPRSASASASATRRWSSSC